MNSLNNRSRPLLSEVLNPLALRKGILVYKFGLSECNRVKIVVSH